RRTGRSATGSNRRTRRPPAPAGQTAPRDPMAAPTGARGSSPPPTRSPTRGTARSAASPSAHCRGSAGSCPGTPATRSRRPRGRWPTPSTDGSPRTAPTPRPPRPEKIGVSGAPAWHLSLRGRVRPPRNTCTPPVIRFDTVAVSTRTPEGAPATIVFVLMADEGEQGVQPEETIDRVVASLRYDISV